MRFYDYNSSAKIADMIGKVFTSVKETGDTMVFENETDRYVFFHSQNCCEEVRIEDITGDLSDLEGEPRPLPRLTGSSNSRVFVSSGCFTDAPEQ